MFKKLIDGELSLKDTFWKFGVLGLLAINLIVKIFGKMLVSKLGGYSISGYYAIAFKSGNISTAIIILTVLYLSSLIFLIFYSFSMVLGTWRSSAEYNRSVWLRHIARILMLVFVVVILRASF